MIVVFLVSVGFFEGDCVVMKFFCDLIFFRFYRRIDINVYNLCDYIIL